MDSPFFITGYPRSMTAWVSVALGCAHERDGASFDDFMSQLETGAQIGNSDSTASMFYDAIYAKFPNSKWVIIERDKTDAIGAFCRVSRLDKSTCTDFFDNLEKCMSKIPALRVNFSDVTSRITEIWSYCRPKEIVPKSFLKRMALLNIQQLPKLIQIAAKTT